jgi:hypothetical protein
MAVASPQKESISGLEKTAAFGCSMSWLKNSTTLPDLSMIPLLLSFGTPARRNRSPHSWVKQPGPRAESRAKNGLTRIFNASYSLSSPSAPLAPDLHGLLLSTRRLFSTKMMEEVPLI